ncbi:hypothetical protein [Glycomyces artemisiae]|uniref:SUKH-4 immunity protein of toxin-antitoxin system n=1 Tax=Glycomyces artemisiae TaxID=1076443 RepID=A0A2T0UPA6_9ACTN|nr:hypothetical protein [Glycomyces artemisiae]PRY59750.1 hypothetical protein B0I28_103224 [Glycomyces artemisiae]
MGHLESMRAKIDGLRERGADAELARRWEDDAGRYNAPPLRLGEPVALAGAYPGGLADLYLAAGPARFGEILLLPEAAFGPMDAIDAYGEPIDGRRRLRIGDVGEDAVLLDLDSGAVIVYWFNYFERGWDSGVLVECGSAAEFADTVAMGPGYAGLHGPKERQRTAWWDEDPWFAYLRETGLAGE